MNRIEDFLIQDASLYPDKTAVVCGEESITYGALWQRVQQRTASLCELRERSVIVRASQDIDFLVTYFAAHIAGKVMVPLEADVPQERYDSIRQTVLAAEIPQEVSDILYTTGTTGQQKGTMISQRAIIANADNLVQAQGFTHDVTFIISGPLNHIGSLSKVWPILMVGGTLYITAGMKNMDDFFHALDYAPWKSATFLVPASIRMLLQFGRANLARYAGRIDFIETGAAPISQSDMEALCGLLPDTRLYNTYASTETGIICTHDYNGGYCVAGCLGRPMRHSQVAITAEGLVSCQGDTLMTGYVGDAELTATILHDGAAFTNDSGTIDSEGRLHLTGREGDIINIGGYKVNPTEVEDAAQAFDNVADCICIADKHPVLGTALRLLVVTKEGRKLDRKALALFIMARLEKYKVPQMYSQVERIERTYNGKLNRKHYRKE